tara:strand:+ start:292 stop:501 length:210 start_codon:yes stop_codon:yes gene_type:complete
MTKSPDPFALHRISIQITNSQYETLKQHSRPGTSISSLIRRSIDNYFISEMKQAIENKDYLNQGEKVTV